MRKHRNACFGVRRRLAIGCLVQSERFSAIDASLVISEYLLLNETLLGKEVDMGDTPSADRFVVRSLQQERAREIVGASLETTVLEYRERSPLDPVEIAVGPGGAVLLRVQTRDPEQWHDLVDFARRIEAAADRPRGTM